MIDRNERAMFSGALLGIAEKVWEGDMPTKDDATTLHRVSRLLMGDADPQPPKPDGDTTLSDCPFCGSGIDNSTPTPFPVTFNGPRREFVVEWAARCGNPYCGAEIRAGSPGDCAERWNRRKPQ